MKILEEGKNPDLKQARCNHCRTKIEVHINELRIKLVCREEDIDGHGRYVKHYVDEVGDATCPVCAHNIRIVLQSNVG